jgi:hypothetical protein
MHAGNPKLVAILLLAGDQENFQSRKQIGRRETVGGSVIASVVLVEIRATCEERGIGPADGLNGPTDGSPSHDSCFILFSFSSPFNLLFVG